MNRLILPLLAAVFLTLGGLTTGNAMAQSPYGSYQGPVRAQRVVVYAGGGGYGTGYGGGNIAGYGYGYAPYVAPITPYYYPTNAPYGAGYSGGYQPYQQMYLQRLYYGLGN